MHGHGMHQLGCLVYSTQSRPIWLSYQISWWILWSFIQDFKPFWGPVESILNFIQSSLTQHTVIRIWIITYLASTFSDINDLVFPKGNLQTGQVTSFGWHSLQTTWPRSHWKTGAALGTFRHTGHSRTSFRSSAEIIGCFAAITYAKIKI